MKNNDDSIFIENTTPNEDDIVLFRDRSSDVSIEENNFFFQMERKEMGEFAPSADLLLSEHDNVDQIYFVRYYFNEYRIGRGLVNERTRENIYVDSLADALNSDLYQLLDRHISLLEWFRENNFKGIDYDGNYALH